MCVCCENFIIRYSGARNQHENFNNLSMQFIRRGNVYLSPNKLNEKKTKRCGRWLRRNGKIKAMANIRIIYIVIQIHKCWEEDKTHRNEKYHVNVGWNLAKFPTDSRRQLSKGATQLSDKQHGTQQLKEDRRKKQPSSYFQSVVEQTFAVAVGYFFWVCVCCFFGFGVFVLAGRNECRPIFKDQDLIPE